MQTGLIVFSLLGLWAMVCWLWTRAERLQIKVDALKDALNSRDLEIQAIKNHANALEALSAEAATRINALEVTSKAVPDSIEAISGMVGSAMSAIPRLEAVPAVVGKLIERIEKVEYAINAHFDDYPDVLKQRIVQSLRSAADGVESTIDEPVEQM